MSELAELPKCRVCGNPVMPEDMVGFGTMGQVFFVTHATSCADVVRHGTKLAGRLARTLLERKQPVLLKKIKQGAELTHKLANLLKG